MKRLRKTWISSAHQGFVDEGLHSNTLKAFENAAMKGADMIETDARMTRDGVLIANHDETVKGFGPNGEPIEYIVSETDYSTIKEVSLLRERKQDNFVPRLEEILDLAYFRGMCVNIDLKEGIKNSVKIAETVVRNGMSGRVVYATNGAGAEAINLILSIDPLARFIDTKQNYTRENLKDVKDYHAKCFVYTSDFSDSNIEEIRRSGCMLAAISLNKDNARSAFRHHPDMAEYPHTSDFEAIDNEVLEFFTGNI